MGKSSSYNRETPTHLSPVDERRTNILSVSGITLWTKTRSSSASPNGPGVASGGGGGGRGGGGGGERGGGGGGGGRGGGGGS